jgi:cytochrome c-type biogenesis protein CcmH/NrfG
MTLIFCFIAWAMTVLVLGSLLWPLIKRQEPSKNEEGGKALLVYRKLFGELDQDHQNAMLTVGSLSSSIVKSHNIEEIGCHNRISLRCSISCR